MWKPVERQRIAEEVAGKLRDLILRGEYRPGDKLPPERKLAGSLGVNRATLREALKNLEQMGLVRIRQGDGTRVLDFVQTAGLDLLGHLIGASDNSGERVLRDVMELRQILGREMARLAAKRATPAQLAALEAIAARPTANDEETLLQDQDFYMSLAQATGNMLFSLLLNPVRTAVRGFSGFFVNFNPPREAVREHHREVIDALRRRDCVAAADSAGRHLERGMEHFFRRLEGTREVLVQGGDGGDGGVRRSGEAGDGGGSDAPSGAWGDGASEGTRPRHCCDSGELGDERPRAWGGGLPGKGDSPGEPA